ncbi:glycosyltransferase family 4 protein [Motiliproteus sediminis]|uniref:glycosyltransferase family 4 protein n=1 Tax=Motiliproteus sediminis TaxID=1468178 RepID=UPI001AEFD3BD|nr:glycosyltransferase family 4 protein [Motiliproteus sediminis]
MRKPKILMVIDKPNWAYDQMANYIMSELSDKYDFYKVMAQYHIKNERQTLDYKLKQPFRAFKRIYFERFKKNIEYDLVVYMWWHLPQIIDLDIKYKYVLKGIFTESFPPGKTIDFNGSEREFVDLYIKPASGIISGNRNIERFYSRFDLPVFYATGATNTEKFIFNKKKRDDDQFIVCWTGNPNRNFKGFYDFVKPAVELARKKRPNIKLVTRFSGPLSTLPDFYSNVDVMANASIGDAGPGFIIDAGGCGIPTISTNVGFASEIIRDYENGIFVEREIENIAEKIIELNDDRELLNKLSVNISRDIHQNWGYSRRAMFWDEMFENVLGGE